MVCCRGGSRVQGTTKNEQLAQTVAAGMIVGPVSGKQYGRLGEGSNFKVLIKDAETMRKLGVIRLLLEKS